MRIPSKFPLNQPQNGILENTNAPAWFHFHPSNPGEVSLPKTAAPSGPPGALCALAVAIGETMGNHRFLVFAGESSFQGFLGWCEMDFVHPQYW